MCLDYLLVNVMVVVVADDGEFVGLRMFLDDVFYIFVSYIWFY